MIKILAALACVLTPIAAKAELPNLDNIVLPAGKFEWANDNSTGRIRVVVDISSQMAYVYRGGTVIGISSVSTGKSGKETPVGIFPILQKHEKHRSSTYNNAPMPYMLRLTWDGVALHAGHNPGYAASHGCVRLPTEFAAKLFAIVSTGDEVDIEDNSAMDSIPESY